MREIVLDTETTGLNPTEGHRIVEIGAVELVNHLPTGETFHQYINPERDMPIEAFRVHGLSEEFLLEYPVFSEVCDRFCDFIGDGSVLIIHNAAFDLRFLNAELAKVRRQALPKDRVIDTLALAQKRFPGAPVSLDALCRRFGVDSSSRTLHGALLDSELLAECYLHLIGGRQTNLSLDVRVPEEVEIVTGPRAFRTARAFSPNDAELQRHLEFVANMKDAVWLH